MELQKPSVGRIVHYSMPDGRSVGQARPAMIVRVWDGASDYVPEGHVPMVQLQVFTDGSNDGDDYAAGLAWKTSVHYDAEGKPGTWRWPPRV
jgi:hypothetical protein